jgi:hypothetical protein
MANTIQKLALVVSLTASVQAAHLSFVPQHSVAISGSTVSADILVSGLGGGASPALGAFQFDVLFQPSIASVTAVDFGLSLGDPSLFAAITFWDATLGPLSVASTSLLPPADLVASQAASFVLATVHFVAGSAGVTPLDFSAVVLSSEDGTILPFTSESGSITVLAPEPATAALLAGTLAGAVLLRRLRQRSVLRRGR